MANGKQKKCSAGAQKPQIIGTSQSFNVGTRLVSEPPDDESFRKITGTCKKCNEKDNLCYNNTHGTRGSFNARGGSEIDATEATINSGRGAGDNIDLLRKIKKKYCKALKGYKCCNCNKNDKLTDHKNTYGTRGSFNAKDGSKIDATDATINSGCGAGTDEKNLLKEISKNCNHFQGGGTEKSFNVEGKGKKINIRHAKLNTGAFAGIATE